MKPPKQAPWNNSFDSFFTVCKHTRTQGPCLQTDSGWPRRRLCCPGRAAGGVNYDDVFAAVVPVCCPRSCRHRWRREGKKRSSSSAPEVNWSSSSGGAWENIVNPSHGTARLDVKFCYYFSSFPLARSLRFLEASAICWCCCCWRRKENLESLAFFLQSLPSSSSSSAAAQPSLDSVCDLCVSCSHFGGGELLLAANPTKLANRPKGLAGLRRHRQRASTRWK